jgi:hypothetical protein
MAKVIDSAKHLDAQTTLDAQQIDGLLTGNTVYLEIPPGGPGGPNGGLVPFLYGADGRAVAKLPSGTTLIGTWKIHSDHYAVDWSNGPKNSCSRVIKSDGEIGMFDYQKGALRGHVSRIVPGNPENL